MTLTTILPSLRRSLPDPIDLDRWPAHTTLAIDDVLVDAVSMTRLAGLCDTPCVHTATAVVPGTQGRPSATADATVAVTRVLEVIESEGIRSVLVDAHLELGAAIWSQARLIGRASTAHVRSARLLARDAEAHAVDLPDDVREGDLLAVPMLGLVMRRALLESRRA